MTTFDDAYRALALAHKLEKRAKRPRHKAVPPARLEDLPPVPLQFPYVGLEVSDTPRYRMRVGADGRRETYVHSRADWVKEDAKAGVFLPRLERYDDVKARSKPEVRDLPLGHRDTSKSRVAYIPNRGRVAELKLRQKLPRGSSCGHGATPPAALPTPTITNQRRRVPWHVFAVGRSARLCSALAYVREVKGTPLEDAARRELDDAKTLVTARDRDLLNRRLP